MIIEPIELPIPRLWGMGVPPASVKQPCAAGIDVRQGSWDVAIGTMSRSNPDQPIAKLLFYGKVRDEKDVIYLCHQYPVRCGIADARPEQTIATRMIDKLRRQNKRFWLAQYTPNTTAGTEILIDEKKKMVTLHRTMALDKVFYAASAGLGLALPDNYRDICGGQFLREMCNSTRVPVIERGEESWSWTPCQDHAHHAMAYMMAAMEIGKKFMGDSTAITTLQGSVQGGISANSDLNDIDSDFVDPFQSPGEAREMVDGTLTWGDDAGF